MQPAACSNARLLWSGKPCDGLSQRGLLFVALYPEALGLIRHNPAGHAMFEFDALGDLASRLDPQTVGYNCDDLPIGVDPDEIPANGLSIVETVRGIESNGSWMVLKFTERDPAYRVLLETTLRELSPVVTPRTASTHQLEEFIFLSSPGSVTPLHFDPEHNILLQLRGTKTMTVFPQTDAKIAPDEAHERFHKGLAHRNLAWREDFALRGRAFYLKPGDVMHVPVMAPHWVKNRPDVSGSFSVTRRSEWSYAMAGPGAFNSVLRTSGLNPAQPARYPVQNHIKALAWRALRKSGVVKRS